MADSRRSSRARKQVDYSKFSGAGDELGDFEMEDDDFVSFTPPTKAKKGASGGKDKKPAKKEDGGTGRKRKRKERENSPKTASKCTDPTRIPESLKKPPAPNFRLSLDDKIYERDLQMALELSQESAGGGRAQDSEPPHLEPETLLDSELSSKDSDCATEIKDPKSSDTIDNAGCKSKDSDAATDKTEQENKDKELPAPQHIDVRVDRESSPETPVTKKRTVKKKPAVKKKKVAEDDDPDEIKVLAKDVGEPQTGGRGKRRAATKAVKKFVDSDSDDEEATHSDASFKADGFSDDQSDQSFSDNGDDDDFNAVSKSRKKVKGRSKISGSSKASPKPRPRPRMSVTVTPINKNVGFGKSFTPKPTASLPGLNNNPPLKSTSGPLHIRRPKWMPPGSAGTSRSHPSDIKSPGNLRVGLSKKARVKPLHTSNVKA